MSGEGTFFWCAWCGKQHDSADHLYRFGNSASPFCFSICKLLCLNEFASSLLHLQGRLETGRPSESALSKFERSPDVTTKKEPGNL